MTTGNRSMPSEVLYNVNKTGHLDRKPTRLERELVAAHSIVTPLVTCFCRGSGIYSIFALKRVARMSGRKPTFLLLPVAVH